MDNTTYPDRDAIRQHMDLDVVEHVISSALETLRGEAFIKNKKNKEE